MVRAWGVALRRCVFKISSRLEATLQVAEPSNNGDESSINDEAGNERIQHRGSELEPAS